MTQPNNTGAPRAAVVNVSIRVLQLYTPFRNIDAARAMYGCAVLPCPELVPDTHPPTRNQIPWLVLCRFRKSI